MTDTARVPSPARSLASSNRALSSAMTDTARASSPSQPETVVVIGNGMVGHRFCEKLVELDPGRRHRIVTFCEEPRPAYDRVGLTRFFDKRDPAGLMLATPEWYEEKGIALHVGDRAIAIDREARVVRSARGQEIRYDRVVLATGSAPFVPPIPGVDKRGVFVYRTIEDLEAIIAYAEGVDSAAVIGGGLLGLEAAKAAHDLGLETHVVEFMPRLMPRQVDDAGSRLLVKEIEALGVRVRVGAATKAILGNGKVQGDGLRRRRRPRGGDGHRLRRHPAARRAGARVRARGGRAGWGGRRRPTRDQRPRHPRHRRGRAASRHGLRPRRPRLRDGRGAGRAPRRRHGARLRRRRPLDEAQADGRRTWRASATTRPVRRPPSRSPTRTRFGGVYKKLLFSPDGKRLVGGILVGDASDYGSLMMPREERGRAAGRAGGPSCSARGRAGWRCRRRRCRPGPRSVSATG